MNSNLTISANLKGLYPRTISARSGWIWSCFGRRMHLNVLPYVVTVSLKKVQGQPFSQTWKEFIQEQFLISFAEFGPSSFGEVFYRFKHIWFMWPWIKVKLNCFSKFEKASHQELFLALNLFKWFRRKWCLTVLP